MGSGSMRGCGMKIRQKCEEQPAISFRLLRGSKGGQERQTVEGDLYLLQQFGSFLDSRIGDETGRDHLISRLLKIRTQTGSKNWAELYRAQRRYSANCSRQK